MSAPLLEVEDLAVHFAPPRRLIGRNAPPVRAVDGISFSLERGRTLALVGESGCGKSTTGYAVLRLVPPTRGRILYDGVDIATLPRTALLPFRRRMQIIFQDSAASLNPRMPVADLIAEALEIHGLARGAERPKRVRRLLDLVGIASRMLERYPHELSGGQAQRIAICRALAVEPELIVCDEPVSALDVSIQAQIINLLQDLQTQLDLSYLFISHDLSVVRQVSNDVAVMYLGRIVEQAPTREVFANPTHPYTRALLSAAPVPDPEIERKRERIVLQGDLPSPSDPPSGCRFRTRCPIALPACAEAEPPDIAVGPDHRAACIRIPVTA
ncbi:MAG TPA: ABC transporter ATP-binding protein [Falsiroseomonas sp.]|jgi:oligopeptide/dipeptide ABC transporter ATP-binding protein|nr:ABC transporter ATP-binding protein [Falsiroseomonas sp.]